MWDCLTHACSRDSDVLCNYTQDWRIGLSGNKEMEDELRRLQALADERALQVESLERVIRQDNSMLQVREQRLEIESKRVRDIQQSVSFRVGRAMTLLPRKVTKRLTKRNGSGAKVASRAPSIVHIIPKSKFTHAFIGFTNESFHNLDIGFIVYGEYDPSGYVEVVTEKVRCVDTLHEVTRDNRCLRMLDECQVIVLNWVNLELAVSLEAYLHKTYLLFWGGDFYPYVPGDDMNVDVGILERRDLLRTTASNAAGVMTLLPQELNRLETVVPEHGTWYTVQMCDTTDRRIERHKLIVGELPRNETALRVIVGNSAAPTNRHIPIITELSRFSGENIEVFAPLSYGSDAYRDEVIAHGVRMFGDKFHPLTEFMPMEAYQAFLSTISVGVFNQNRQQGLGNIISLMRFGAKVYLSQDSVMPDYFSERGLFFKYTEDIRVSDYADFARIDSEEARKNMEALSLEAFREGAREGWRAFYSGALRERREA